MFKNSLLDVKILFFDAFCPFDFLLLFPHLVEAANSEIKLLEGVVTDWSRNGQLAKCFLQHWFQKTVIEWIELVPDTSKNRIKSATYSECAKSLLSRLSRMRTVAGIRCGFRSTLGNSMRLIKTPDNDSFPFAPIKLLPVLELRINSLSLFRHCFRHLNAFFSIMTDDSSGAVKSR